MGYLSYNEALKLKDRLFAMYEAGELHRMTNSILTNKNYNTKLVEPDDFVQTLILDFLRPTQGLGMTEPSELHRFRMYNPAKGKFETFVYQCLSNIIYTQVHKASNQPISYESDQEASLLDAIPDSNSSEFNTSEFIAAWKQGLAKFERFVWNLTIEKGVNPLALVRYANSKGIWQDRKGIYTQILKTKKVLIAKCIADLNAKFGTNIPDDVKMIKRML